MKKSHKILISVFVIFTVLFSVAVVNINSLLESYIREVLDDAIKNSEQGVYDFQYEDVDFHVWNGSFEITGVNLHPKEGITDSIEKGNLRSVISGEFNTLSVVGLSFWEFYKTKKINIEEIIIHKPKLELLFNPEVEKPKRKFDFKKIFNERLQSIKIEKFYLQDVDLDINNILRKNLMLSVDSMDFTLNNIKFDTLTINNAFPISYSGIYLYINKLSANISPYYMLKADKFLFKSDENTLEIDSIDLVPKYSVAKFNSMQQYPKAYLKINATKVKVSGLDMDSIIATKKIYLDKILIKSPHIDVFKNKQLKESPYSYKKIWTQIIREIPIKFKVDTIKAENGFIKVRNIGNKVKQTEPAIINFHSVFASITGLTNDSIFLKKRPVLNIYFYSKFMGAADLKAQINMPIFHSLNLFQVKGSLAQMDATVLNDILYRLLLMKVKTGNILSCDFEFEADKDSALGFIDISYKNLKIDIKNTEKPNKSVVFVNALVNTITKTNNIKGMPGFTRGFISYKRDYNDKFIKYLWKTINNGIMNTLLPAKEVKGKSKKYKKDNKQDEKTGKNKFKLFNKKK